MLAASVGGDAASAPAAPTFQPLRLQLSPPTSPTRTAAMRALCCASTATAALATGACVVELVSGQPRLPAGVSTAPA